MPYTIVKRDGKFCVVRVGTADRPQETQKCHDREADAVAHLRALKANVKDEGT